MLSKHHIHKQYRLIVFFFKMLQFINDLRNKFFKCIVLILDLFLLKARKADCLLPFNNYSIISLPAISDKSSVLYNIGL